MKNIMVVLSALVVIVLLIIGVPSALKSIGHNACLNYCNQFKTKADMASDYRAKEERVNGNWLQWASKDQKALLERKTEETIESMWADGGHDYGNHK